LLNLGAIRREMAAAIPALAALASGEIGEQGVRLTAETMVAST
jgi:hypothetical protein